MSALQPGNDKPVGAGDPLHLPPPPGRGRLEGVAPVAPDPGGVGDAGLSLALLRRRRRARRRKGHGQGVALSAGRHLGHHGRPQHGGGGEGERPAGRTELGVVGPGPDRHGIADGRPDPQEQARLRRQVGPAQAGAQLGALLHPAVDAGGLDGHLVLLDVALGGLLPAELQVLLVGIRSGRQRLPLQGDRLPRHLPLRLEVNGVDVGDGPGRPLPGLDGERPPAAVLRVRGEAAQHQHQLILGRRLRSRAVLPVAGDGGLPLGGLLLLVASSRHLVKCVRVEVAGVDPQPGLHVGGRPLLLLHLRRDLCGRPGNPLPHAEGVPAARAHRHQAVPMAQKSYR